MINIILSLLLIHNVHCQTISSSSGTVQPEANGQSFTMSCDSGTISVTRATYGINCDSTAYPDPFENNALSDLTNANGGLADACDGLESCTYQVSTSNFYGDPAGGCGKTFEYAWDCLECWEHIMTAGCSSILTADTYGAEGDDCWKGYTDAEINAQMTSEREMMIVFGSPINNAPSNMYIQLVNGISPATSTAVRDWSFEPNPNGAKWKWDETGDYIYGPCSHDAQIAAKYFFFFKTSSRTGTCAAGNYENRVLTTGFTNVDGADFWPQTGWSNDIKIYARFDTCTVRLAGMRQYSMSDYCQKNTWDSTAGITFTSDNAAYDCMYISQSSTWLTWIGIGEQTLADYAVEFRFKNGNHESAFIYVYFRLEADAPGAIAHYGSPNGAEQYHCHIASGRWSDYDTIEVYCYRGDIAGGLEITETTGTAVGGNLYRMKLSDRYGFSADTPDKSPYYPYYDYYWDIKFNLFGNKISVFLKSADGTEPAYDATPNVVFTDTSAAPLLYGGFGLAHNGPAALIESFTVSEALEFTSQPTGAPTATPTYSPSSAPIEECPIIAETQTILDFSNINAVANGGQCEYGYGASYSIVADGTVSIRSGNTGVVSNVWLNDCFTKQGVIGSITFTYQFVAGYYVNPGAFASMRLVLIDDADRELWSGVVEDSLTGFTFDGCGGCASAYSGVITKTFDWLSVDTSGKNVNFMFEFTNNNHNVHIKQGFAIQVDWGNRCTPEIGGNQCVISGDPHTDTWNGAHHDFQGVPDLGGGGKDQFYYIYPCAGTDFTEQPFALLGTHYRYGSSAVSGLDYLTFRLFEAADQEYLVFLSTSFTGQMLRGASDPTSYDDLTAVPGGLVTGDNTIGTRFIINIAGGNGAALTAILTIDGTCEISLTMSTQWTANGRNRMHLVTIQPPSGNCYKCTMCGLCGDFTLSDGTMPDCYGNDMTFSAGYSHAYDADGWSWEQSFTDTNCDPGLATQIVSGPPYEPPTCTENCDPCMPAMRELVKPQCQTIMDQGSCCGEFPNKCEDLRDGAIDDVCTGAGVDENAIDCTRLATDIAQICTACDANPESCYPTSTGPEGCTIGDWDPWTDCSASCGGGEQTRERSATSFGGTVCAPESETRACNEGTCSICQIGANYDIEGGNCVVTGDPHFTTWGAERHDLQGAPAFRGDSQSQFYYIYPCTGYVNDFTNQPFALLGRHYSWGGRAVTGLDYITFRLFEAADEEYLVFISTSFTGQMTRAAADTTLYDDKAIVPQPLAQGDNTIGTRFSLNIAGGGNGAAMRVTLTVDGFCSISLTMTQQSTENGRVRMHQLIIEPPQNGCFKCSMCGLCGDFTNADGTMPDCDGNDMPFSSGYSQAYDPIGWTWEEQYAETCDGGTGGPYEPPTCTSNCDPCVPAVRDEARAICNTNAGLCCANNVEACERILDSRIGDICAAAGADITAIDCSQIDEDIAALCTVCDLDPTSCDGTGCTVPTCETTPWSDWDDCDASCGGGEQSRIRTAVDSITGAQCGTVEETRACNEGTCSMCQIGTNYEIEGRTCVCWGDPHCTMWDGALHDFQGDISELDRLQFNYIYPCAGSGFAEQPFALIGQHYSYGGRAVTGLEYVVLRLVDTDSAEYVVFISTAWGYYNGMQYTNGIPTTTYEDYLELEQMVSQQEVSIGTKFTVTWSTTSNVNKIEAKLTVDGECDVEFSMEGQYFSLEGRWRMHQIIIQPPSCYKCTACGLCGDFQGGPLAEFETCDGGSIAIESGTSKPINYDKTGWSWEQTYLRQNCEEGTGPYVPDIPTDVPVLCNPANEPIVRAACDAVLAAPAIAACCTGIGATRCEDVEETVVFDLCTGYEEGVDVDCSALGHDVCGESDACVARPELCDPAVVGPPNCDIGEWGPWGDCDADCDGGAQIRTRTNTDTSNTGQCDNVDSQEQRGCNAQTCALDQCTLGQGSYKIGGNACSLWGDPHYTTFNGARHDFQGAVTTTEYYQYYYMHPCKDSSFEDQPFALIGSHERYGAQIQPPTGLDYVVLRLVERDGTENLVFLSSGFAVYDARLPSGSTVYEDYVDTAQQLTSGERQIIGSRFAITVTTDSTSYLNAVLSIDGLCDLKFSMSGQYHHDGVRWRMHSLTIEQSNCYKCTTCGLCGSFEVADGTMQGCNGEPVAFWAGTMESISYDPRGWSWEQQYVDNTDGCEDTEPYTIPQLPPPINTCQPDLETQITLNCQAQMPNVEATYPGCCTNSDRCEVVMDEVIFDKCLRANTDCTDLANVLYPLCTVCDEDPEVCDPNETTPPECDADAWSEWGDCDAVCDGGQQARTRTLSADCTADVQSEETRPCNTHSCLHCERGRNYAIDGRICDVWGDPHFTNWAGDKHDLQGDISELDNLEMYYIHPCQGYSFADLPFAMIGKHTSYGGRGVTGLDYITLMLFEQENNGLEEEWLVFISSDFQKFIKRNSAIGTDYDDNRLDHATQLTNLSPGDNEVGKFNVHIVVISVDKVEVTVTLQDECTLEFSMSGQHYYDHSPEYNRWRMHHLIVQPLSCYRCAVCGLCGDYKHVNGDRKMQDVFGGEMDFMPGVHGGTYAVDGWTWEVSYVEYNFYEPLGLQRRRLLTDEDPDPDPVTDILRETAEQACQAVIVADCCPDIIGEDQCGNFYDGGVTDASAAADGDVASVDCSFLSQILDETCTACAGSDTCGTDNTVPANCGIEPYGPWTECTLFCGGGTKTRTRTVTGTDAECAAIPTEDTVDCNINSCCADPYPKSFDWDTLTTAGADVPQFTVTLFDIDRTDLSLNIRVELDYLGKAFADEEDDPNFGVTYVLDFEDFNAHTDKIDQPGTCQNRQRSSFETANMEFDEFWTYSDEPQNGNVGTDSYLAYPTTPSQWEVYMSNDQCATVVYEGKFSWQDLRDCYSYTDSTDSYTDIESDEGWLNLTGTFYINVVSPFWYGREDMGFYRVYQLLSQPFVIAVSSSVYVLGSTGINLMTISVIAVYKEDSANDFRLVLMTETAEYMQLTRNENSLFVFNQANNNMNDFTNVGLTASLVSDNSGCLSNKLYICTQLWEVFAEGITCINDAVQNQFEGTDFSGDYILGFQPQCLAGDNFDYCEDWLEDHGEIEANVQLTASLYWKDEICTPEVFEVQFGAEMFFFEEYADYATETPITADYLYEVGVDTIFAEVRTDFADGTLTIFNTELINVWICTFAPGTVVPEDQEAANWETEMGCFNGQIDDYGMEVNGWIFRDGNYITGNEMDYEFALITDNAPPNNYVRFSFTVPPQIARDTLYIHAQIEVGLEAENGNRRRALLDVHTRTSNQMKHFVNEIGIKGDHIKDEPKTDNRPKPEQPQIPKTPLDHNPSQWYMSLSSPYVYFIGSILAIVLCCNVVFMLYVNCFKSQSLRSRVSFNAARRSGYKSVKPSDSSECDYIDEDLESDNSEIDAINVISE